MSEREEAMKLIQSSGIINPKVTLGEIMEVSSKLDILNPGDLAAWTLLSRDFLYKGSLMDQLDQVAQQ